MTHGLDVAMNANDQENNVSEEPRDNKLVRLIKSIVISPERGKYVDDSIVKFKYYNAFNYSLLSKEHENVRLTVGITSPKQGEGKTLVASNLAVSLALGSQKNTILVDLNVANPRLHQIFGVPRSPGLAEAFLNGQILVSRTAIDNLAVLPVGNFPIAGESMNFSKNGLPENPGPFLGLDQLAAFRDVIYSLEQEFDLIIVDMPSIRNESVPVLFANQLNGVIVVIDSGRTKREEVDGMFHHLNERQVLGFVFNRVSDDLNK
jgi:Mrp family chromosome partitioning ATPase